MLQPCGSGEQASGLFGFGLRFGSVTGFFGTCAFAKASPKPKNPRSARLQYFFKRSRAWLIGSIKDRPLLAPKIETTFDFVETSPQPFTTTNLTAKISFSRVVLNGGKLADVKREVTVNAAAQ